MTEPNHDEEMERMREPANVPPDPSEPDVYDESVYPRSECCGAAMVNGGRQCSNCGSDGKIIQD